MQLISSWKDAALPLNSLNAFFPTTFYLKVSQLHSEGKGHLCLNFLHLKSVIVNVFFLCIFISIYLLYSWFFPEPFEVGYLLYNQINVYFLYVKHLHSLKVNTTLN